MADDFYNLKRIYEGYDVAGTQTNTSQGALAKGPSFNTTTAMGGPGHEPITAKGGAPASGDLFNMPNYNHLSIEQLTKIAEQAIKMALDQAHRADKQDPALNAAYEKIIDLLDASSRAI